MSGLRPHEAMAPLIKRLEEATGEFLGGKKRLRNPGSESGSSSQSPRRSGSGCDVFRASSVRATCWWWLIGYRNFLQSPCTDGGCSTDQETRPGLWGYEARDHAAVSVRGEYFFFVRRSGFERVSS